MLAVAQSLAMLFAARVIDGLSGGNITIARAYIADVTEPDERAKAFGFLGAAFGLGFIVGPGLAGLFAHISYTAPIWAAAAVTVVATAMAWLWLPETVHRGSAVSVSPWRALPDVLGRPHLRPLLDCRFRVLVLVCGVHDDVRALRVAALRVRRRAHRIRARGIRAARRHRAGGARQHRRSRDWRAPHAADGTRHCRGGVGVGCRVQHRADVSALPDSRGNRRRIVQCVHRDAGEPQRIEGRAGHCPGAAGALESLGRAIGPMWGHGALQRFGEGSAYATAAIAFFATTLLVFELPASCRDPQRIYRRMAGMRRHYFAAFLLCLVSIAGAPHGASTRSPARRSRFSTSTTCTRSTPSKAAATAVSAAPRPCCKDSSAHDRRC